MSLHSFYWDIARTCCCLPVAWLACSVGFAAEPKPKDASPKPAAKARTAAADPSQPLPLQSAPDPVVDAVMATKPSTPEELFRAAKILAGVKPELAKKLLGQLLAVELTDAQWAALSEKVGQGTVLQLANQENLLPEGRRLADRILKATAQHLRDPQQLTTLAKQLAAPSPQARREAMAGLEKAGAPGAASLIAVLADPQRGDEHAVARAALAQLGTAAIGPLLAAMDSADPALIAHVVRTPGNAEKPRGSAIPARPAVRVRQPRWRSSCGSCRHGPAG